MTDKEMKTMIERIKNLIQFIESPDNAELSDGEVLDYTIDELKKLTDDDKEILDKLFEFETYCTARFDSEVRVALVVLEYVRKMKQDARHEMSSK
jgi:hypothetical protein